MHLPGFIFLFLPALPLFDVASTASYRTVFTYAKRMEGSARCARRPRIHTEIKASYAATLGDFETRAQQDVHWAGMMLQQARAAC